MGSQSQTRLRLNNSECNLQMTKGGRKVRVRERLMVLAAGFANGGGSHRPFYRQPVKCGKGKESLFWNPQKQQPCRHLDFSLVKSMLGFPGSSASKECRRPWFDSWVGKMPWRSDGLPTPVLLGFSGGSDSKRILLQCGRPGLNP